MQGRELDGTFDGLATEISTRLNAHLAGAGSALVGDPAIAAQLHRQVESILASTLRRLGFRAEIILQAEADDGLAVGELRARQNIHPVDSLTAATHLFDIALDVMTVRGLDAGPTAKALNASIMANVIPASVAYVDVLLERLAVAHSEERLGISRELHDRVAHGIAAGIQRVELARKDDRQHDERIHQALRLLEGALDETRAIALDLRHAVGEKHLDQAVRDYVADLDASGPAVQVNTVGDPYVLTTGTQEEAFIVLREAIHNARRHSQANRIVVTFTWQSDGVVITVVDNGVGFRHDAIRTGALGLIAAQERAELIGAELSLDTTMGQGTTVSLNIARKEGAL